MPETLSTEGLNITLTRHSSLGRKLFKPYFLLVSSSVRGKKGLCAQQIAQLRKGEYCLFTNATPWIFGNSLAL